MKVAVMGAGITGACVALELAEAGCQVDLFDRAAMPLSKASFNNEGKIHLGLVYGKDPTGKTAETMIKGAVCFRKFLSRWVNSESFDAALSKPFLYAVPRDSMLTPDEVRRHFDNVSAMFKSASSGVSLPYVCPIEMPLWDELRARDFSAIFDPKRVLCAFRTQEIAVDPRRLCAALRTALAASTRMTVRCLTTVEGVSSEGVRFQVRSSHAGQGQTDTYDTVVNALWEQRLAIDASTGLHDSRPVAYRYKVGLRTNNQRIAAGLPSVTFVMGEYGDTVGSADYAYASWYPTGLLHQEFVMRPRLLDVELGESERQNIIERSLSGLRDLMPGVSTLLDPSAADWEVVGGYITAWGKSGIDDARSQLHERHAVGVTSHGNYHTIDTGKFTTGPLFASEACARILHREAASA